MNPVHKALCWRLIVPCLVVLCWLLPSRAAADPLTVTWNVVPREDGELDTTNGSTATTSESQCLTRTVRPECARGASRRWRLVGHRRAMRGHHGANV